MKPDDIQPAARTNTPHVPQRSYVHTPPSRGSDQAASDLRDTSVHHDAAADVIRSQIDSIYHEDPTHTEHTPSQETASHAPVSPQPQPTQQPQQTIAQDSIDVNPYQRTASNTRSIQAEEWKQYHSAWQEYYQKYYEGYYTHHLKQAQTQQPANPQAAIIASGSATADDAADITLPDTRSPRTQAVDELRQKLLGKVRASATQVRRSKHFVPIIATGMVVLAFLFLQYNQLIVANVKAYVSPGTIDPQNIIVNPNETVKVSEEPRLIIPKINVDAPVFYDIGTDNASQMKAMANGVAHFPIPGANSHPGEIGNTVISGHSTNDVFAPGDYKFIFIQLDKLGKGDIIYANYEGVRYTYVVTKKEVVLPSQVNKLVYDTNLPVMTLITCTPLGTAEKRLLVTAEQVSPDPSNASAAPTSTNTGDGAEASIPGQGEPTLLERIFGN